MGINNQNIHFQIKKDICDDPFYSSSKFMHKCHVCGKQFYVPCADLWSFRRQKKSHGGSKGKPSYHWFCTWGCLSKYEKTEKPTTSGQWATRRV